MATTTTTTANNSTANGFANGHISSEDEEIDLRSSENIKNSTDSGQQKRNCGDDSDERDSIEDSFDLKERGYDMEDKLATGGFPKRCMEYEEDMDVSEEEDLEEDEEIELAGIKDDSDDEEVVDEDKDVGDEKMNRCEERAEGGEEGKEEVEEKQNGADCKDKDTEEGKEEITKNGPDCRDKDIEERKEMAADDPEDISMAQGEEGGEGKEGDKDESCKEKEKEEGTEAVGEQKEEVEEGEEGKDQADEAESQEQEERNEAEPEEKTPSDMHEEEAEEKKQEENLSDTEEKKQDPTESHDQVEMTSAGEVGEESEGEGSQRRPDDNNVVTTPPASPSSGAGGAAIGGGASGAGALTLEEPPLSSSSHQEEGDAGVVAADAGADAASTNPGGRWDPQPQPLVGPAAGPGADASVSRRSDQHTATGGDAGGAPALLTDAEPHDQSVPDRRGEDLEEEDLQEEEAGDPVPAVSSSVTRRDPTQEEKERVPSYHYHSQEEDIPVVDPEQQPQQDAASDAAEAITITTTTSPVPSRVEARHPPSPAPSADGADSTTQDDGGRDSPLNPLQHPTGDAPTTAPATDADDDTNAAADDHPSRDGSDPLSADFLQYLGGRMEKHDQEKEGETGAAAAADGCCNGGPEAEVETTTASAVVESSADGADAAHASGDSKKSGEVADDEKDVDTAADDDKQEPEAADDEPEVDDNKAENGAAGAEITITTTVGQTESLESLVDTAEGQITDDNVDAADKDDAREKEDREKIETVEEKDEEEQETSEEEPEEKEAPPVVAPLVAVSAESDEEEKDSEEKEADSPSPAPVAALEEEKELEEGEQEEETEKSQPEPQEDRPAPAAEPMLIDISGKEEEEEEEEKESETAEKEKEEPEITEPPPPSTATLEAEPVESQEEEKEKGEFDSPREDNAPSEEEEDQPTTFIEHPSPTGGEEQQEEQKEQTPDDKVDDGIDSVQSLSNIKSRFQTKDEKPPMPRSSVSPSSNGPHHVNGDHSPPEVVNRSESTEEILERELPPVNMARSMASRFREMESPSDDGSYRKPVRKITPPREDVERDVSAYHEEQQYQREGVVRADEPAEKEDERPPPSFTKNMLAKFKEMEDTQQPPPSPARSATSPTKRAHRPVGGTYMKASPDEGIADTEPSVNGHNQASSSAEVIREADKNETEELPERGFTKSLLSQWRQIEQTAGPSKTSLAPRAPGSTPTGSRPGSGSGRRQVASPASQSQDSEENREVVREADTNEEEYLPPPSYTKNMLAKFQTMQQEAQKDPATTPTKKQFKWTVKEAKTLWNPETGREELQLPQSVNGENVEDVNGDNDNAFSSDEEEDELYYDESFELECDAQGNPLYPTDHPKHPDNVRRRKEVRRRARAAQVEVVRAEDSNEAADLPPPDTTKKLLSRFKSMEDVGAPVPTPERASQQQRSLRSSVSSLPRPISVSSMESREQPDGVETTEVESPDYNGYGDAEHQQAENVVREADVDMTAELPEQGTTRNLLAKFQSLQAV